MMEPHLPIIQDMEGVVLTLDCGGECDARGSGAHIGSATVVAPRCGRTWENQACDRWPRNHRGLHHLHGAIGGDVEGLQWSG
jgi:hypothetical protein